MHLTIRFFAVMAHHAKTSHTLIDIPSPASVADVTSLLRSKFPTMPWPNGTLIAVNQEYASPTQLLHEGDEVAIIPPVSGG